MMPTQPAPPGAQPPGPPPNPQLQQAQAQLEQIQKQLEQIQENKQVLALLRDEKTRGYRIEIETDSTIEPDEQAEKKSRIEFTEVCGKFLGEALPTLQVMPQAAPMFEQVFLFLVRGFRAGRELEDTIETTMAAIKQAAQQPKPDPEQMKVQAQMAQADQQHQQTMQQNDQQHQQKMEIDAKQGEMKLALEQAKMAAHEQQHAMTMQAGQQQAQLAEKTHGMEIEAKQEDRATARDTAQLQFEGMDREQTRADAAHQQKTQQTDQAHGAKMKEQQGVGVQEGQAAVGVMAGAAELKEVISEAMHAIADSNKLLAKAMTAPKRITRDKQGRAVGAETVMQ